MSEGPINVSPMNWWQYLIVTAILSILSSVLTSGLFARKAVNGAVDSDETANSINKKAAESVKREAQQVTLGPEIGEIRSFAFGGSKDGPTIQELRRSGWLECAGQELSVKDYSALHDRIHESWGSKTPGITFTVPDLRSMFLRGWSHGKPTETRTLPQGGPGEANQVGTAQEDTASIKAQDGTPAQLYKGAACANNSDSCVVVGTRAGIAETVFAVLPTETRPKNVFVYFAIYAGRPIDPDTPDGN